IRGVDRMRPLPERSSADNATSRLKAPLMAPSASPTALGAPGTPSPTPVPTSFALLALTSDPCVAEPVSPPTRPPREPLFGNARLVVLPMVELTRPLKPHCTPRA